MLGTVEDSEESEVPAKTVEEEGTLRGVGIKGKTDVITTLPIIITYYLSIPISQILCKHFI